jgi:hypothetical protein
MSFALGFLAALVAVAVALALGFRRRRRLWRSPFRGLFRRLHTTSSQERILLDESASLRELLTSLRAEWKLAREELASLLGEPSLEASLVESVLASRDDRLAALRRRAAEALTHFHAALDDAQREVLARTVREGFCARAAHAHRGCG